jgi:hypothetical protein
VWRHVKTIKKTETSLTYLLLALVTAAVGTLPWLIVKFPRGALIQGGISFPLLWWLFYATSISTVWPLFGVPGFFVLLLWAAAGLMLVFSDFDESAVRSCIPAGLGLLAFIGAGIIGSEFANTDSYKTMIGTMEIREWTQDVQPKDERHMRMSTTENAFYQAVKVIGQDGSIGSQFQINGDELSLQMIKGELWYVAPLEFSGFGAWNSKGSSPGYVKVSAENPDLPPVLVNFAENQGMRYAPSAWFGKNLERHLRKTGYLGKGLDDFNFELDEDGKGWWVVTVFEPTIMWWGSKVTGVVIVDPNTGEHAFHEIGNVPQWVDRVVPHSFVENYLTWWGKYVHGWGNAALPWRPQLDLLEPSDANLIYGTGGEPEWVTDITSTNGADNSLVGLVYTNSRTGKSVYYKVPGGGTNSAVLEAVAHNQDISFKKLHGVDPQLYNVLGTMASVVPLFNDAHAFSGVAIVPINNVQKVAFGRNQYEALRQYEKIISDHGEQVVLGAERTLEDITGVVDRVSFEVTTTGNLYYIHLAGVPHLFTGGSGDSPKLTVTKEGDRIKVTYYKSDRDVVPMHSFDNLSLPLSENAAQSEVRTKAAEQREGREAREDSTTVESRLDQLTPEQRRELLKKLPKKPK